MGIGGGLVIVVIDDVAQETAFLDFHKIAVGTEGYNADGPKSEI